MAEHQSQSRRNFLMRSGAVTLAAAAGPSTLAIISSDRSADNSRGTELTVSKDGFPPYQIQDHPGVQEYATLEAISNGVPVWSFSNLYYIYGGPPDLIRRVVMR